VVTKNNYDALGRLESVNKQVGHSALNSGTLSDVKTIAKMEYDALGQLSKKTLEPDFNSGAGLESLSYDYNIRGWLLGANRDYAKSTTSTDNYFGFDLGYDKTAITPTGGSSIGSYSEGQFNGNIAGTTWKSRGDNQVRKYDFGYDPANRLLKADFTQLESTAWTNTTMNFNVKMGDGADPNTAYDANGNILRMQQWGWKIGGSEQIDDLRYTYNANSNKLQNVIDLHNDPDTKLGDFKTSVLHPDKTSKDSYVPGGSIDPTTVTDYTYDANGNMKKDLNKDITTATNGDGIEYNYLNLPERITVKKNGGIKGTIEYAYDAAGNKLKKTVVETGVTVQTDAGPVTSDITTTTTYIGGFIYESKSYSNTAITTGYPDQVQFFGQEEGRIRPVKYASGSITSFAYDYFIKDHLGNVRMVLTDEQKTDKYPTATLELSKLATEQNYYTINTAQVVDASTVNGLPGYTNDNGIGDNPDDPTFEQTNSQKLYKLNSNSAKTGLGMTLKVMAGDVINIYGKSYYFGSNTGGGAANSNLTTLEILAGMLGTSGGIIAGASHGGIQASDLNELPGTTDGIGNLFNNQDNAYDPNSTTPKASINYLIFDEQFNCIGTGFSCVGANSTLKDHHQDLQNIEIPKNGYIYIYCSNESPIDVFFDNLQVTHKRGPILEETHYYPFGLTMTGISSKTSGGLDGKKKFQGQEFAYDEFSDGSGLEMYEFKWRMDDPQTGRFWQLDPLADKYVYNSVYAFSENQVTSHVELEGKEKFPINTNGDRQKEAELQGKGKRTTREELGSDQNQSTSKKDNKTTNKNKKNNNIKPIVGFTSTNKVTKETDVINSGVGDKLTVSSYSGQVNGQEGSVITLDGTTNTTNQTKIDGGSFSISGVNVGAGNDGSLVTGISLFGVEAHVGVDVSSGLGVTIGGSYTNKKGNINGGEVRASAGGVTAAVVFIFLTGGVGALAF
jgi:hypothetical protein